MTVSEANDNFERTLAEFERRYPYQDTNEWRKRRNKHMQHPTALIFNAIKETLPKPEIDFQI